MARKQQKTNYPKRGMKHYETTSHCFKNISLHALSIRYRRVLFTPFEDMFYLAVRKSRPIISSLSNTYLITSNVTH